MVSISKPLVGILLVVLMVGLRSLSVVRGDISCVTTLPSNTIFFDDFESKTIAGSQSVLGAPANGGIATNNTIVWAGNQSLRIRSGTVSGGGYEDTRDFGWL